MKKQMIYQFFLSFFLREINVGISVLDRREYVRFAPKVGVYKKIKKLYSILKTFVVMEFLQTTQWELGEKIQIRNRNLDVIHNYLMILRILVSKLNPRRLYKKPIYSKFFKRELMVTWNIWLGWVITNFKDISKHKLVRLRTKKCVNEREKTIMEYVKI